MALNALRRAVVVVLLAAGHVSAANWPDLLEIGTDVVSRRLYQAYERGDGWSLAPKIELGLAGFAATSRGPWGVFLDLEGGVLLENRANRRGFDDLALILRYRHRLEREETWVQAAYRQSFYSERAGVPAHSEEVFLRFQTLVTLQKPGFNINPFAEVAYDFTRYDGIYVAVGFEHAMSLEDKLGTRASIDMTGRVAWSDRRADDLVRSREFGFHHARIDVAVPFEREFASGRVLALGPVVGWDWADDAVRTTGGFSWGVRLALER